MRQPSMTCSARCSQHSHPLLLHPHLCQLHGLLIGDRCVHCPQLLFVTAIAVRWPGKMPVNLVLSVLFPCLSRLRPRHLLHPPRSRRTTMVLPQLLLLLRRQLLPPLPAPPLTHLRTCLVAVPLHQVPLRPLLLHRLLTWRRSSTQLHCRTRPLIPLAALGPPQRFKLAAATRPSLSRTQSLYWFVAVELLAMPC
jgi:hypothetical protein